jgi:ubiquinone/menaquinone biosynthesis C-methylase UbiE
MSSNLKDSIPDSTGWSADQYNQFASFVYSSSFTASVLELLAAKPGERIIDFGCGSGELLQEIQRIVLADGNQTGMAVGFDMSESKVRGSISFFQYACQ